MILKYMFVMLRFRKVIFQIVIIFPWYILDLFNIFYRGTVIYLTSNTKFLIQCSEFKL